MIPEIQETQSVTEYHPVIKLCTLYETEIIYVSRCASTWRVINFLSVSSFSIHAAPYLWLLRDERFSGLQSQKADGKMELLMEKQ